MTTEVNATPKVALEGPVFGTLSALDEEVILRNAGTNHNSSNSQVTALDKTHSVIRELPESLEQSILRSKSE